MSIIKKDRILIVLSIIFVTATLNLATNIYGMKQTEENLTNDMKQTEENLTNDMDALSDFESDQDNGEQEICVSPRPLNVPKLDLTNLNQKIRANKNLSNQTPDYFEEEEEEEEDPAGNLDELEKDLGQDPDNKDLFKFVKQILIAIHYSKESLAGFIEAYKANITKLKKHDPGNNLSKREKILKFLKVHGNIFKKSKI